MDLFVGERNNEGTKNTFHKRRLWEGLHDDIEGRGVWEDYE
jgi:hypothetical protein